MTSSPSTLLAATLSFAFLSLMSSFFVIVRTIWLLLPPHPILRRALALFPTRFRPGTTASARTAGAYDGGGDGGARRRGGSGYNYRYTPSTTWVPMRKDRPIRRVQRFQLWFSVVDQIAVWAWTWSVLSFTASSSDALSTPAHLSSSSFASTLTSPSTSSVPHSPILQDASALTAARLVLVLTLRPTVLLSVSILTFLHICLGHRDDLGRYDYKLWLPPIFVSLTGILVSAFAVGGKTGRGLQDASDAVLRACLVYGGAVLIIITGAFGYVLNAVAQARIGGVNNGSQWQHRHLHLTNPVRPSVLPSRVATAAPAVDDRYCHHTILPSPLGASLYVSPAPSRWPSPTPLWDTVSQQQKASYTPLEDGGACDRTVLTPSYSACTNRASALTGYSIAWDDEPHVGPTGGRGREADEEPVDAPFGNFAVNGLQHTAADSAGYYFRYSLRKAKTTGFSLRERRKEGNLPHPRDGTPSPAPSSSIIHIPGSVSPSRSPSPIFTSDYNNSSNSKTRSHYSSVPERGPSFGFPSGTGSGSGSGAGGVCSKAQQFSSWRSSAIGEVGERKPLQFQFQPKLPFSTDAGTDATHGHQVMKSATTGVFQVDERKYLLLQAALEKSGVIRHSTSPRANPEPTQDTMPRGKNKPTLASSYLTSDVRGSTTSNFIDKAKRSRSQASLAGCNVSFSPSPDVVLDEESYVDAALPPLSNKSNGEGVKVITENDEKERLAFQHVLGTNEILDHSTSSLPSATSARDERGIQSDLLSSSSGCDTDGNGGAGNQTFHTAPSFPMTPVNGAQPRLRTLSKLSQLTHKLASSGFRTRRNSGGSSGYASHAGTFGNGVDDPGRLGLDVPAKSFPDELRGGVLDVVMEGEGPDRHGAAGVDDVAELREDRDAGVSSSSGHADLSCTPSSASAVYVPRIQPAPGPIRQDISRNKLRASSENRIGHVEKTTRFPENTGGLVSCCDGNRPRPIQRQEAHAHERVHPHSNNEALCVPRIDITSALNLLEDESSLSSSSCSPSPLSDTFSAALTSRMNAWADANVCPNLDKPLPPIANTKPRISTDANVLPFPSWRSAGGGGEGRVEGDYPRGHTLRSHDRSRAASSIGAGPRPLRLVSVSSAEAERGSRNSRRKAALTLASSSAPCADTVNGWNTGPGSLIADASRSPVAVGDGELSRKEALAAMLRMGYYVASVWLLYIMSLPYIVFALTTPSSITPPTILPILLSVGVAMSAPLLALQVLLTDGLGFSFSIFCTWFKQLRSVNPTRTVRRDSLRRGGTPPLEPLLPQSFHPTATAGAAAEKHESSSVGLRGVVASSGSPPFRIDPAWRPGRSGGNAHGKSVYCLGVGTVPYGAMHWRGGSISGGMVDSRPCLFRAVSLVKFHPRLEVLPFRGEGDAEDAEEG